MEIAIPKSNAKDLTKIFPMRQYRNPAVSKGQTIVGMDTETDRGDIFMICASDGRRLEYPNINIDSVLRFLMRFEGDWVFFHSLDYDANCFLKLLPEEVLSSYRWKRELRFAYKGYHIHYIDRRQLTIRKDNHSVSCYDIMQYYDNSGLVAAYKAHTGKKLTEGYLRMKSARKDLSRRYFVRHKKRVREYCLQDCLLTKGLAEIWARLFYKTFGFYPRRWTSAGYLAEKVLIVKGVPTPPFWDVPYEVQEIAWSSFYGGRFELLKRGFMGRGFLYDINSAYPKALTTLPDLNKGHWVRSKVVNPRATLGFFFIRARIDDLPPIAPFPFRTKDNRIIYPAGQFETYVTLEELKVVGSDRKVQYEILDSYQFVPQKDCGQPLKDFIERSYERRQVLKNQGNSAERAIKLILNSIWGKTAQRRGGNAMGNLFNPVIAAYVTGFTRARLYGFVKKHGLEKETIAFATDSVAIQKEVPGLDSEKLGEMKLDKSAEDVIFLSNGFYRFNGEWKKRGVGADRERKVEIEHLETRVSEDGDLCIKVRTTRVQHIKSGILYNRLKDVGKIEEYEKKIKLNSDKKRVWLDDLTSLGDGKCCESAPINANMVAELISKADDIAWENESDYRYEPTSEL